MSELKNYRGKFVKVKTAKKRSKSSAEWLKRQLNDPYVLQAQTNQYRSRAAYKLIEINDKFQIFNKHTRIVDLGAAPGGWSQVASEILSQKKSKNKIVAIDLLEMGEMVGVEFLQADFLDPNTKETIVKMLGGSADVVMSDMASNTTGHRETDHIRIMSLCEDAFDFATEILSEGGHFIAKIFRGGAESELLIKAKQQFRVVKHFKPKSSRKESSEFYLIALDKKQHS